MSFTKEGNIAYCAMDENMTPEHKMSSFDQLHPAVRRAVTEAPYSICCACIFDYTGRFINGRDDARYQMDGFEFLLRMAVQAHAGDFELEHENRGGLALDRTYEQQRWERERMIPDVQYRPSVSMKVNGEPYSQPLPMWACARCGWRVPEIELRRTGDIPCPRCNDYAWRKE